MPTISAVIPAYNGASRYLDQAIDSVLAQTYRDLELIVVDDASTDETARLVLRFPQARYFRRAENGGQAMARNDGARLATGEFLAFLDQDDLWEPTFLEEALAAAITRPDAAAVHADGYQVDEQNRILEYTATMKHLMSITQMLRGDHHTETSGSLLRKTCFEVVGGYDEQLPLCEDIDLGIRLYQRYPLIHLPKPLFRHRVYGHNVSRDIPSERALQGRRRFLEKHGPSCKPGTREAAALKHDWGLYYGDLGKHYVREGKMDEARRAYRQSLRYRPLNHTVLLRLLRSYLARRAPARTSPSPHT